MGWILAVLSVAGYLFVAKKNVVGLWLWLVANIGWVVINLSIKQYAQVSTYGFFVIITGYGIWEWTKDARKKSKMEESTEPKPYPITEE